MCLGIPGEVMGVSEREGLPFASVRFGGITREVCLSCQPDVAPGDFVLVHVGLAIAKIDRARAERAWQVLRDIGQAEEGGGDIDGDVDIDVADLDAGAGEGRP